MSFERFIDGKVKMTERRKEILYHIAYTNEIAWRSSGWRGWGNRIIPHPFLGRVCIVSVMRDLRRLRLIRWPPGSSQTWITQKGMTALLATVKNGELLNEKA